MKKIVYVFIIGLLFMSACSDSPSKVTKNFMENLMHGKIEKAKEYATDATCKQLDLAAQGGMDINPDYKCNIKSEEIDGNKAVVKLDDHYLIGPDEVKLVKIDGKWKVHLTN